MKTRLSKVEQKTALLYGRIHALTDMEDAEREAATFLTARHLETREDFLAGKKCLDAGCGGKGRALKGLFRLGSRDITAIDISEINLENARNENKEILDCVNFKFMSILDLDASQERFDFIHCSGVVHHMENPQKAIEMLYRCLKPGGHLYIGVFGRGGILYGVGNLFRGLARLIPYNVAFLFFRVFLKGVVAREVFDYLYVPFQFHFSEDSAVNLLREVGLTHIKRLNQPEHKAKSFIFNFLKPCYYDPKTFIGRFMAGDGWIVLMAQKELGS
ncbi:MAG: class I SAM-dependent methyltransferase [Candidatus Omnitrophota bacterium]